MVAIRPIGMNTPQDIAAALKYGPQTTQAMQRSTYLSDALRELGAEGSKDIRSPGELAAKLLAVAIMNRTYNKQQNATMEALKADQKSQLDSAIKGTPLADPNFFNPPPPAPAPPPAPSPQPTLPPTPPPEPAPIATAPPDAPPQPTPSNYSPQDRDALTRMLATEAIGEGPAGMTAAGYVALNRLKNGYGGAKSLSDVVYQPHQFEGMSRANQVHPEDYDKASQVADALLSGQVPDPTGGAMAFLNPDLQLKLGRNIPAWASGNDGHRIGNHVFFGGNPQLAQQSAPDPAAAINAAHQLPPGVLAGGGDPSQPPQAPALPGGGTVTYAPPDPNMAAGSNPFTPPAPGVPSTGPGAAPVGVPPQAVPTGAGPSIPHQVVTPDEWKTAFALAQDWHTRDLGLQEIAKLKMRSASPIDMKPGTYFTPDGVAHSVEQFQDQPGSPNAFVQRSTLDNSIKAQNNPAYGSLPTATSMNNHGEIRQQPIAKQDTFRIPGVNGVFVTGPDGRPTKVGDDQYGPSELLKMRENLLGSQPVQLYQQAADAYGSMKAAAAQNPGGMRAYALLDTFARAINPGAVARVGTIQAIKEARGVPAAIEGWVSNLKGDGNVPPEIAQQILDVTQGFVASHYKGAKQLVDSNVEYAKRHQIDPADIVVPLEAPERYVIPTPKPAAGMPNSQDAQAAVLAEIARRKAAGTWKGH